MSKGSIPAGTCLGKDVTCHRGWGWLRLGWRPSESSRGERNRRCLVGTARRKASTDFCSRSSVWSLHSEAKPWPRSRCPGRAVGSALCSGERSGSPGCPGGTARRENKALRSQKPTFTPGGTLGLCPTDPALIAAALAAAGPGGERLPPRGERSGEGRDGGGREGRREGGGEEAGAGCGQRGRLPIKGRRAGGRRCGAVAMAWGCALCLALAGGALLALLVQLLRWLRADGDLTLLWAERWGKKPGNTTRQGSAR